LDDFKGRLTKDGIRLHTAEDFAGMHRAGHVAARILDDIAPLIVPGQITATIDTEIERLVAEAGATSATIGYRGYKHASCISVNHVVCHGIPGAKVLKDGDILNIDVTVIVEGWFGDTSRMYVAGKLGRKAERLIDVTHDALMKGIEAVRPGNGRGFKRAAEGRRGVTAWVEREGMLRLGDTLRLHVPDQRAWALLETVRNG